MSFYVTLSSADEIKVYRQVRDNFTNSNDGAEALMFL